ncbi:MAG: PAS domain S-box protein [Coprothermobacterota bacterium]|nr:PAS domain S-box protein [Coprothermobacterota bacterium]
MVSSPQDDLQSFRHFTDLLEPLGLFFYRWSPSPSSMDQIFFSPKLLSLTGYPLDHFPEPSVWLTLLHPEDRVLGEENARKLKEGIACISEYRIITKDGAVRWIRDAARPLQEGGKVAWIEGAIQDITALREAEQAMQRSEEREKARAEELDAILESVPVAILIAHDRSCLQMTGNRFTYEQLHLIQGSNVSLSTPVDKRPSGFRLMKDGRELPPDQLPVQTAAQTGVEVRSYEYDIVFPDGTARTLLGNASPLLDAAGQPRGAVGSFVDITEEKRAEEALRASETRYRALFEAANDAIFLMDGNRFLDCNERALQMYGCEYSEIIGHTPAEFSPERQPDGNLSQDGAAGKIRAALAGNPQVFEWQHLRPDGVLFDAEISLNLIQTGEKRLVQAIVRDVTERRELERIMEKARADFLFAVSHELKTPLLVMSAAQETLRALPSGVRTERFVELEEVWQRNLLRLRQIIENLVDSQRPKHMGMKLVRAPADLIAIVRHTIEELTPYASSLRVKIDLQAEPLPLLPLDTEAFPRLAQNLLTNAVKFSKPGGMVRVSLQQEGENALLQVEDEGVGFDPKVLPLIFEPFYRSPEAVKAGIQGTGLGLYVARLITEAHGGSIELDSEPGKGCRVTVRLPLSDSQEV